MDIIGEVNGGGPLGQALYIAVGGENKDLVGKEVHLQGGDKLLGVGVLLALQQPAHPLKFLLGAQLFVGHPLLILPVGGDAVLGGLVHLPGAYLHLKGDALPADDGGVEGLVHVGLGGADVVLEPAQHRLEHVVDAAQHVVALRDVADNHPEGVQVKNFVQGLVLGEHFAVDGVDVLHPAVDGAVEALLAQALLDALLDAGQKLLVGGGALNELVLDLLVAHRVQIAQGQVLQLPLDFLHAQAVGDGGIDLHGLQGFFPLLPGGLVLHGAHVVQPVAHLNENHPDIPAHGHEHFSQILHLLLFLGDKLHLGQLGDPLHQLGHRGVEPLGDLLVGGSGVLNTVVKQGGHHAVDVQLQVGNNLRHGDGMDDIGLAALAQLAMVGGVGVGEGVKEHLRVQTGHVGEHPFFQRVIAF